MNIPDDLKNLYRASKEERAGIGANTSTELIERLGRAEAPRDIQSQQSSAQSGREGSK